MFDVGFSEIVVIAVVALIVIGPERLPRVARTLGHMFGRMQRYVNDVKADINREIELDELRKLQQQVQTAARDIEQSVSDASRKFETGVRSIESDLNAAAGATPVSTATASSAAEPSISTAPPSSATSPASPSADAASYPGSVPASMDASPSARPHDGAT